PVDRHPSLPMDVPISLQSVIAVTDQQLSADQQAALHALSVFPPKPSSFSEEAALAVANCSVETLDALLGTGLVESSEASHYTIHQTIVDYAHLQLKGKAAHERLITYTTGFVEARKKDYETLEQESAIVLAALEAAYTLKQRAELIRSVYAFTPYL